MEAVDYFSTTLAKDLFNLLADEEIGRGSSREVYTCRLKKNWVIKFEVGAQSFQNIKEWDLWENVQRTKLSKWFAPCHFISNCGKILIQEKTLPIADKESCPLEVPAILTDLHLKNFGYLRVKKELQFVCHDYGMNLLISKTLDCKMRKAVWHDY